MSDLQRLDHNIIRLHDLPDREVVLTDLDIAQLLVDFLGLQVLFPDAQPDMLEPLIFSHGLDPAREDLAHPEAVVVRVHVDALKLDRLVQMDDARLAGAAGQKRKADDRVVRRGRHDHVLVGILDILPRRRDAVGLVQIRLQLVSRHRIPKRRAEHVRPEAGDGIDVLVHRVADVDWSARSRVSHDQWFKSALLEQSARVVINVESEFAYDGSSQTQYIYYICPELTCTDYYIRLGKGAGPL